LVGSQIKEKTTFGGFLGVIRPYSILPKFVLTLLRTPLTREALIDNASQTTNIANISLAKLKPLFFAIPPLAEQHRIVAKVDELMALCDQLEQEHSNAKEAHETLVSQLLATLTQSQNAAEFNANWQRIYAHFDVLFTTEASIDALKQTLLQLAVMGKLVPQDPNDEPASALLKRIQAEKAKLIAEGKLKKEKPLAPITEDEKPFELPKGWEWVRFTEYSIDISTGPFGSMIHQSDYIRGGVPLINPSHMINDRIVEDDEIAVSKEFAEELQTYKIFDGDIVMARRGEVGRIAVVREKQNGWLCGTGSFVLRFAKEVNRDYLKNIFRNSYIRTYLAGEAVGTTMVNLNHTILKHMVIAIPPVTEQHRIVAKVDALMALCDQLKTRIQQANQQQHAIADALVAQAVV
jgi:type I restriction enzyme S subunit